MGYMLAGSVAELPIQYVMMNLTDFDHMNFFLTLCAVSPTDPFPHKFLGDVLLIETNSRFPGFARLKVYNSWHTYLERSQLFQSRSSGPAHTGTFMSLIELSSLLTEEERRQFQRQLQKYEITNVDLVSCVICPIWPTAALEWIRRQRNNGWPTKEVLSKVVHGGCHFVAKAHPSCPNDETLFRFSFSAAEVVLVNSWSSVQKYIYHILRLIKASVAKQCEEKQIETAISSYTMKTLMLWACEDKPPSFWNNSSITTSVTELLSELIEWLIEGRCQNYFISNNNMFEYPMGDVELTVQVLSSFVCNESQIEEILVKWPCANPEAYFPIELSDKLLLLVQLGLNRVSHFVDPIEQYPNERFNLQQGQLAAGGSEFFQLVTGLIANLQLAIAKRVNRADPNNDLMRMARIHLDHSMRTDPQSTNSQKYFYLGKSFLENVPYLAGRKKPDHHRKCIYNRKQEMVSQMEVKVQKTSKKHGPSGLNMITSATVHLYLKGVDKSIPKASYFMSAAYRSNFYFTHLEQYRECLRICEEAEKRFSALKKNIGATEYYDHVSSVVLTVKWSVIFDQCIQTVFGFVLLHELCLKRLCAKTRTSLLEFQSSRSFVLYISPMAFIRYVANNCRRRLSCVPTAQELVLQYQECSGFLIEAVYNDHVVRMTAKSQKILRTLGRKIGDDILNTIM